MNRPAAVFLRHQQWSLHTASIHFPRLLMIALCAIVGLSASRSFAEAVDKAETSRKSRMNAIQAIPLDKLDKQDSERVRYVLENTSLYRKMPTQVIECDPNLYLFLVQHPEVVVNMWEVMGVSEIKLKRLSESMFKAEDGEGTTALAKVVHGSYGTHVIYAEGSYTGSMLSKPLTARCVLMLRSRYLRDPQGRQYVTCRMDAFVHIERAGLELIAKTVHPLLGSTADHNFTETMSFLSGLSRSTESDLQRTERIVRRLSRVQPEVREKMLTVSQKLASRTQGATEAKPVGHRSQILQRGQSPRR